jgi:anti-sigma B factor antagonist
MNITCETTGDAMSARIDGSIDASAVAAFNQSPELQSKMRDIVIDLAGVDFMDSAGLGALVMLIRGYREAGRKCVLASAPPIVAKILKVTSIHQLTPVAPDMEQAFQLLRGK